MLCEICIDLLKNRANLIAVKSAEQDRFGDGPYIMNAHHQTTQTLQTSAEEGCHVCLPFWSQLSPNEREALRAAEARCREDEEAGLVEKLAPHEELLKWLTITILLRGQPYGGDFALMVAFSGHGIDWSSVSSKDTLAQSLHPLRVFPNGSWSDFTLERSDSNRVPDGRISHANHADNTASGESWNHATVWLEECISNHTKCNEMRGQDAWYPTRLLDLGETRAKERDLRLIYTSQEGVTGPYCTLSHCWGQAHFIQLNKDSLSSLKSGFPVSALPKTFREAVEVTRRLGVRYIWIDSLCIQQDDWSDWAREAGLMHQVYLHSHCNISASASKDSSEGLFRARQPHLLLPTQVEVCVADLGHESDQVQCQVYDYFFWTRNVSNCTINKRAWVVQERLLSPRVLHFGDTQLCWECKEHDACESYPSGLPDFHKNQSATRFKALDATRYRIKTMVVDEAGQHGASDPADANYHVWNAIINAYSQTLLTVPSDKLIALSGITKYLSSRMDDTYIAGMWRRHLHVALLWQVNNGEKVDGSPSSRPQKYRAPSWTWASVDGVISTRSELNGNWKIRVEDYHLEHATSDITGIIDGGWLDLCGNLKPMSLIAYDVNHKRRWQMVLDGIIVRSYDESVVEWHRVGPIVHLDVLPSDARAFDDDNHQQRLFYMVSKEPKDDNDHVPVLLVRLCDASQVRFERIGVAMCDPVDGLAMLAADLSEGVKSSLPCSRYEDGLHTIRII